MENKPFSTQNMQNKVTVAELYEYQYIAIQSD